MKYIAATRSINAVYNKIAVEIIDNFSCHQLCYILNYITELE